MLCLVLARADLKVPILLFYSPVFESLVLFMLKLVYEGLFKSVPPEGTRSKFLPSDTVGVNIIG